MAALDAKRELITPELQRHLLARGDRLAGERKWPQALGAYEAMREVAARLDDKAGIALALNKVGVAYFRQGRFEQALAPYRESLALRKELGDQDGLVNSLTNLAQAHLRLSSYDLALKLLQEAYPLLAALPDKSQAANTLNTLGTAHRLVGRYSEALAYYEQAFQLYQSLGHPEGVAGTQLNLGVTYKEIGNHDLSLAHYEKVLALAEAQQNKPLLASAQNNIGSAYYLQGNYGKAMALLERSLRLKEELRDELGAASTLANIGNIYHQQGNYALALDHYQRCLATRRRFGDQEGVAYLLSSIGLVHSDQAEYEKAAGYYQEGLRIGDEIKNDSVIAEVLKKLGQLHLHQGRRAEAEAALQRSLTLAERMGANREIADTLGLLAGFHLSGGRPDEGLRLAARAYALAKDMAYVEALQNSLSLMGKARVALGQPGKAREAFDEAIGVTETLRAQAAGGEQERQRLFERSVLPYYSMVRLLLAQNNPTEALAYAERGKARVLLDILRDGRLDLSKAMTAEEVQQEQRLNIELVSLNTELQRENQSGRPDAARAGELKARLQKARLEYEAFRNRLYAAHRQLQTQRGEAPHFKVSEAAQLLSDPNTALLEYVVTEEATHLFVLTAGLGPAGRRGLGEPSLKVYELNVRRADLAARVRTLHQRIANNDLEFAGPAAELYNLLVGPARRQLRGKTRLVIVPDGTLWEVPFQALRSPEGRYLAQSAAISYAPSLTVLREMVKSRRDRSGPDTLLALGNPAMGDQAVTRSKVTLMGARLEPLPDAERMVRALAQIYGPAASKVYVGAQAGEAALKAEAGKYRVLQLATHGILDNANPLYSHIVLSESEAAKEDGLLEAREIMELDLKAELAVLSACETARGRIGAGEGVIGLSWALFVAGCPTTVVSQWQVESASTTELMVEFHRRLRRGAGKAEALRGAALALMEDDRYGHPFYWAGFIVVGDAN